MWTREGHRVTQGVEDFIVSLQARLRSAGVRRAESLSAVRGQGEAQSRDRAGGTQAGAASTQRVRVRTMRRTIPMIEGKARSSRCASLHPLRSSLEKGSESQATTDYPGKTTLGGTWPSGYRWGNGNPRPQTCPRLQESAAITGEPGIQGPGAKSHSSLVGHDLENK